MKSAADRRPKTESKEEGDEPQSLATKVTGPLKAAFAELPQEIGVAELLRQGLIRLINEKRETGELTIKSLKPA